MDSIHPLRPIAVIEPEALLHFQPDQATATVRFLSLCGPQSALHAWPIPAAGPDQQPLASHSLWWGPADAEQVLVMLSGTHGVEGLAGSALQCDLLARLNSGAQTLAAGSAVLFVHLLNPWGAAWLRRCDQDGIDLNRNFIDFGRALPDNPGYEALRNALLSRSDSLRGQVLARYRQCHGDAAYEIAISGGQYTDPQGPFHGGRRASTARSMLDQLVERYQLSRRRLAVIDLHTGLGTYGYGEIICDHPGGSAGLATALAWYGDAVTRAEDGSSSSVPKTGLLDFYWQALMPPGSCFVTLEFGTFSTAQLFEVILADHRLHRAAPLTPALLTHPVKLALRAHFYPQTRQWQQLALFRTRQVTQLALDGLSGQTETP